jgi:hypothetical protein
MAPMAPLGQAAAVQHIRNNRLPIYLGSPHPTAIILEQDGVFRLRDLVIDEVKAKAAGEAALAAGGGWMPEQYYGIGEPVGKIHLEAPTREELARRASEMKWPKHW